MSTNTTIEWTHATWNPIRGCSMAPGSETGGCLNCYAARQAIRHATPGGSYEGLARMTDSGPRWTGRIALVREKLGEPLRWKKPCRIFVNSMSDLFHETVPADWLQDIFRVMARCPQHTFQILTKRPERMRDYLTNAVLSWAISRVFPLPNVWLGVSVEDQATADARIPDLLRTSAAVRWISYEPALGPVDFAQVVMPDGDHLDSMFNIGADAGIDWVVCGGESGPGARPMHPDWARSVRDQCQVAGVPFFFKQWGEWRPWAKNPATKYAQTGNPDYVAGNGRQFFDGFEKVGKKRAGRLLDGREWSEYPV